MIEKLKELFRRMNEEGIYVPMVRDHKKPSVSLTLLILSSVAVILALLSPSIDNLEVSFWESLSWHITSAVLYYNRGAKISKDGFEITSSESNNQENQ